MRNPGAQTWRSTLTVQKVCRALVNIRRVVGIAVFGALLVIAAILPDRGFTQAPYYQGKTITVIAGTAPGSQVKGQYHEQGR